MRRALYSRMRLSPAGLNGCTSSLLCGQTMIVLQTCHPRCIWYIFQFFCLYVDSCKGLADKARILLRAVLRQH